jgi:hypothetical protein
MADRYWVGGSGAPWNGLAGSKWATTSGGAGGASVPTIADDVFFDANSGGATISIQGARSAKSINCTGFVGGLGGSGGLTIGGSFTLAAGMSFNHNGQKTFTGTGTLTTAGKSFLAGMTINGVGITLTLGDALNTAGGSISLTQGTFDAANYNVSVYGLNSNNANVRTLTMGSGLWTLSGASLDVWNTSTTTNLTFNKDTADILLTSTAINTRNFFGGGLSFNKLTIGGATGVASITNLSSSSFTELASIKTVAHTVRLSGNLGTIDTWSITGTSGNAVTFDSSSAGIRRTFSLTNVTSGIDFLNVTDIGVNQTDRFYVGANSIDGGNNLNVIFPTPPAPTATGNFFMLFS